MPTTFGKLFHTQQVTLGTMFPADRLTGAKPGFKQNETATMFQNMKT